MNDDWQTRYLIWGIFTMCALSLGALLFIVAILTRNPLNQ